MSEIANGVFQCDCQRCGSVVLYPTEWNVQRARGQANRHGWVGSVTANFNVGERGKIEDFCCDACFYNTCPQGLAHPNNDLNLVPKRPEIPRFR